MKFPRRKHNTQGDSSESGDAKSTDSNTKREPSITSKGESSKHSAGGKFGFFKTSARPSATPTAGASAINTEPNEHDQAEMERAELSQKQQKIEKQKEMEREAREEERRKDRLLGLDVPDDNESDEEAKIDRDAETRNTSPTGEDMNSTGVSSSGYSPSSAPVVQAEGIAPIATRGMSTTTTTSTGAPHLQFTPSAPPHPQQQQESNASSNSDPSPSAPHENPSEMAEMFAMRAFGHAPHSNPFPSSTSYLPPLPAPPPPPSEEKLRTRPVGWGGVAESMGSRPLYASSTSSSSASIQPSPASSQHTQHQFRSVTPSSAGIPMLLDVAPDLAMRITRGRELGYVAVRLEEEGNARAAEQQYMEALSLLVPASRELDVGPESSRATRMKHKAKVQREAASMLDRCEEIRLFLKTNAPAVPNELPSFPGTTPEPLSKQPKKKTVTSSLPPPPPPPSSQLGGNSDGDSLLTKLHNRRNRFPTTTTSSTDAPSSQKDSNQEDDSTANNHLRPMKSSASTATTKTANTSTASFMSSIGQPPSRKVPDVPGASPKLDVKYPKPASSLDVIDDIDDNITNNLKSPETARKSPTRVDGGIPNANVTASNMGTDMFITPTAPEHRTRPGYNMGGVTGAMSTPSNVQMTPTSLGPPKAPSSTSSSSMYTPQQSQSQQPLPFHSSSRNSSVQNEENDMYITPTTQKTNPFAHGIARRNLMMMMSSSSNGGKSFTDSSSSIPIKSLHALNLSSHDVKITSPPPLAPLPPSMTYADEEVDVTRVDSSTHSSFGMGLGQPTEEDDAAAAEIVAFKSVEAPGDDLRNGCRRVSENGKEDVDSSEDDDDDEEEEEVEFRKMSRDGGPGSHKEEDVVRCDLCNGGADFRAQCGHSFCSACGNKAVAVFVQCPMSNCGETLSTETFNHIVR